MSRFALVLFTAIFSYPLAGQAGPSISYSSPSAAEIGAAPPGSAGQNVTRVAMVGQSVSRSMGRYADIPGQDPTFQEPYALEDTGGANNFEPVAPAASIWTRIRDGFAIPEVKGRRVAQFER